MSIAGYLPKKKKDSSTLSIKVAMIESHSSGIWGRSKQYMLPGTEVEHRKNAFCVQGTCVWRVLLIAAALFHCDNKALFVLVWKTTMNNYWLPTEVLKRNLSTVRLSWWCSGSASDSWSKGRWFDSRPGRYQINYVNSAFHPSFVISLHGRENQRTLCNFSIWTVNDVGLYKKAVLCIDTARCHCKRCKLRYVPKFTAASRGSPCDSTALDFYSYRWTLLQS